MLCLSSLREEDEMRKEKARYALWVHKATGMYFEPGTTPRLGGQPTTKSDFKWLYVVEEIKRSKKRKKTK